MNSARILILGSTGMLGNAVGQYFINTDHSICLTYRTKNLEYGKPLIRKEFDPLEDSLDCLSYNAPLEDSLDCLSYNTGSYDFVINCIGVIKPFMAADPIAARKINSVFPWELANWCKFVGSKLIHITTDCVYSGKKGNYIESDLHDALDDYGKSKSLGEPDNCMVLRTSIIGEEIHKKASLIEWAKSQKGKEVKGFNNHLWNGITTKQYAKICDDIITHGLWKEGVFHIHSPVVVNKYTMMQYFNERFKLNMTIKNTTTPESCDRSLLSEKELCTKLEIPPIRNQIMEL
jgi:dTDP-4-dehydrorhamnose reductase